jgi:hypothetical protein
MGIIKRNRGNSKGALSWQPVITADGSTVTTAVVGQGYFVDTTSFAHTVTFPASPKVGDQIAIADYASTASTNNISVNPNGKKILGRTTTQLMRSDKQSIIYTYSGETRGWLLSSATFEGELGVIGGPGAPTIDSVALNGATAVNITFTAPADDGGSAVTSYSAVSSPAGGTGTLSEDGSTRTIAVTGLSINTSYTFTMTATNAIASSANSNTSGSVTTPNAQIMAASGGSEVTSGDFKIHTFTADGCFTVNAEGVQAGCCGGPNKVDYFVLGGGGSADIGPFGTNSAGGGGGGGFREGKSGEAGCWTASPLDSGTGVATPGGNFPISVGGGGAPGTSSPGSPSIFYTITSAGGGGYNQAGGSAGGANSGGPGGPSYIRAGNTPPVSPPQGNPSGASSGGIPGCGHTAGGGGGAGSAGSGSTGGSALSTGINGTSTQYAGGGGGGGGWQGPGPGPGGGATAGPGGGNQNASANTGSGGGGAPTGGNGGTGGSGIVILRYKYQ